MNDLLSCTCIMSMCVYIEVAPIVGTTGNDLNYRGGFN